MSEGYGSRPASRVTVSGGIWDLPDVLKSIWLQYPLAASTEAMERLQRRVCSLAGQWHLETGKTLQLLQWGRGGGEGGGGGGEGGSALCSWLLAATCLCRVLFNVLNAIEKGSHLQREERIGVRSGVR